MPFNPETTCDVTIDVSHWQGNIDWGQVKATGIQAVMIKATQGGQIIDPNWKVNLAGASAAGLLVIPYLFLTPENAAGQAALFEQVTQVQQGMPAAIDWEGTAHSTATAQQVEQIGQWIGAVIGRDPLGYWGGSPPGTPTPAMQRWPRWIPRYPLDDDGTPHMNNQPTQPWLFWQYTQKMEIDGISGSVDASLFAGSEAELRAWCQTGALPASLAGAIV